MAKSQQEIYNEIQAEKQTLASLADLQPAADDVQTLADDLTSTSKVGTHRLFEWVISYVLHLHELLWDEFKAFVLTKEATIHYGTVPWWHKSVFAFQYGDDLQWDGDVYAYAAITPANQIVKRCAIEDGKPLKIKVAKLDAGSTVPLTNPEVTALETYAKQIRPAGTDLQIISLNADLMQVHMDVYYNPLVMSSDGSLISDAATFPAEDAVNAYLAELPFNGVFNLNKMVDKVQAAEGVEDPVPTDVKAKESTAATWTDVDVEYNPTAGYIEIDTVNFALDTTITYIPYV